ncbi:hypothetical protein V1517DRAFT_347028 [Lipomyces orientalis]|uniref:Uncharacterized protein n=1 Tax=Lipomyces orientalis TaxID=1233043 RepID=A0ACC3TKC1_9ASCO
MPVRGSILVREVRGMVLRGGGHCRFQPLIHCPCMAPRSRRHLFSPTPRQAASLAGANGVSDGTLASERMPSALGKPNKHSRPPHMTRASQRSDSDPKSHVKDDDTSHSQIRIATGKVPSKKRDKSTGKSGSPAKLKSHTTILSSRRGQKGRNIPRVWDPYVLAEKVKKTLDKGDLHDAITLARDGRDRSTVSWNYIIQSEFQNKHVSAALGYFNEMRKRGAEPNDRTFTLVLNGLAINTDIAPTAVQKCVRLFAYITDQKKDKLNNFHLNAALKVCASASDVDAMWQILDMAGELVEPDEATYTTIGPLLAKEGISIDDVFPREKPRRSVSGEELGFKLLSAESQAKDEQPAEEVSDNAGWDRDRQFRHRRDERPQELDHESSSRATRGKRANTPYTEGEIDRERFLRQLSEDDGRESARYKQSGRQIKSRKGHSSY